jgi:hypothetical protein
MGQPTSESRHVSPIRGSVVSRAYGFATAAQPTAGVLLLSCLLVLSQSAIANPRQATPNDLKAGFCTPFIKARYDIFSALLKANPNEKAAIEYHQKYEAMFNKLRRFVMARAEAFDEVSRREFTAALDSGREEKNRVDAVIESCIIESGGYSSPRQEDMRACFKRRNVEVTKYEECERMDFLPY